MRTWLDPADPQVLVGALARSLAGDAVIVVEGHFEWSDFQGARALEVVVPDGVGRESPESPQVLAFQLEPNTVDRIVKDLGSARGTFARVEAVQIQKAGRLEFIAGDAFHRECVSVGPGVSNDLIQELVAIGGIRGILGAK
jgi:hypothetical protein